MNRLDDFVTSGLQFTGNDNFRNHFCYVRTDKVSAEPLTVLRIEDHLHKAIGGACRFRFPGSGKRKPANLDFITGLFSGLLGVPDGCYLRRAVGASWKVVVIKRLWLLAGDLFHTHYSLR